MAVKAGFDFSGKELTWESVICTEELKAFEALVRADERNRTWTQEHWTEYEQAIVQAEREACAKVCDEQVERSRAAIKKSKRTSDHRIYCAAAQTATWNAAVIRARGNT